MKHIFKPGFYVMAATGYAAIGPHLFKVVENQNKEIDKMFMETFEHYTKATDYVIVRDSPDYCYWALKENVTFYI